MRARDHRYFDGPFVALAHRGGAALPANIGRENTLHAFGEAVELGYRHLETDVHATRDGVLVAFHDDRLDRVTDAAGLLAELPWSEVSQARIHGLDPIPTLAEVLDTFPDTRINIDIKAHGAIAPLVTELTRHRALDRVCVGSFSGRRLALFRSLAPAVATSVSPAGVAWTAYAPLLPRVLNDPGLAFQVPVDWPVRGHRLPVVTEAMVARAHGAGKHVHVWTIDEPAEMHRLIDLGVDGLVTDRPDLLRTVLTERGLWS